MMDIPPNQVIKYTPSFLEKATQAWTQFLAIGVVSWFIIVYCFLGNAYERSILHTQEWSEYTQAATKTEPTRNTLRQKYNF